MEYFVALVDILAAIGSKFELRDVIETVRCPRYFLKRLEFFNSGVEFR